MTIAKVITRAWTDDAYKARLLSDPQAALSEVGVDVPTGTTVKVVEDSVDTQHVVLPVTPGDAGELSAEELEEVAGGFAPTNT